MKKSLTLICLLFFAVVARAQDPSYFDLAQKSNNFIATYAPAITFIFNVDVNGVPVPSDGPAFTALLNAVAAKLGKNAAVIQTEFLYLLFLKYETNPAHLLSASKSFPTKFDLLTAAPVHGVAGDALSFLGGSASDFSAAQSTIIYGITKFALDRAKQELVEVYLDRWYNRLNNDDIIQPMIPNTLSVFKAFNDDNSINLAAYGDKWKTAFQEDLRNLPLKFQDEVLVDKILNKAGISATDELGPVIVGGDSIVYQLYQKKSIISILDQMATNDITDQHPVMFKKLVVMSNMLLSVIGQKDVDNDQYSLIKPSVVKNMKPADWQTFIKLLYMLKYNELQYVIGSAELTTYMTALTSAKANNLLTLIQQTTSIIGSYQKLTAASNDGTTKTLSADEVRQTLDLCFQLIDNMEGYQQLFHPDPVAKTTYDVKVKPFFSYLSQIGEGVQTKQYGSILDGIIGLINQVQACSVASSVIPSQVPAGQVTIGLVPGAAAVQVTAHGTATGGQILTVPAGTVVTPVASGTLPTTIRYLQIYGSFMLNIMTAKSDTAVEAALNELVPQGDYKLKNAPSLSVALSCFPGIWVGGENVSVYQTDASGNADMTKPKVNKTAFAPGVYLPIGVDVNLGQKAKGSTIDAPRYSSWGMMFQVLDLGAVLSYRVTGDQSIATAPTISFKQVLSPGLNLTHHFPNSPVVIGAGANFAPSLREVIQGTTPAYNANSFRYGAFIAIDVTFFNISTGKKQAP